MMTRFLLILVLGVTLVMAFVVKTPPKSFRDFLAEIDDLGRTEATKDSDEATRGESKPDQKKAPARSSSRNVKRSAPVSNRPSPSADVGDAATPAPVQAYSPPVYRLTPQQTTVYATNSSGGVAVGVLTKGQIVEPQYQLEGVGQTWTFVNVPGQRISGFVPSTSVERQTGQ